MAYVVTDPDAILQRFKMRAPVDVVGLAEQMGLRVWEDDLPGDASGKIVYDPVNGGFANYSIIVQKSDPYVRKRFTVAHEIAHFLRHRSLIGTKLEDDGLYRSGLAEAHEWEANALAAEILMPRNLVRQYREFMPDPAALAKVFRVSEAAMRIRLSALK